MVTFETHMKKLNTKELTFTNETNLFGATVTMVLRNKDKKHIISLGQEHVDQMTYEGLNHENKNHILIYLQTHNYLN